MHLQSMYVIKNAFTNITIIVNTAVSYHNYDNIPGMKYNSLQSAFPSSSLLIPEIKFATLETLPFSFGVSTDPLNLFLKKTLLHHRYDIGPLLQIY